MAHSETQHPQLHELAEAVGLAVYWKDYRNQDKVVAPESLRTVLRALDIAAGDEVECRRSLQQLREEAAEKLPGLLVTRVEQELLLPQVLHKELSRDPDLSLVDEQGNHSSASVAQNSAGNYFLLAPRTPGYYQLQVGAHQLSLAIAPECCTSVADLTGKEKAWGVGAQLYSLRRPGDGGVGDFTALRQFAEGMAEAGADGVAVSPVHALFSADRSRFSPYAPSSRLFTNVLHIDPEQTFAADLVQSCIRQAQLESTRERLEREALIDWPEAARAKLDILRCVWEQCQAELMDVDTQMGREFGDFREQRGEALELHAIFETLHAFHFGKDPKAWHWRYWEPQYRDHASSAVKAFAAEHRHEVLFHCFLQWLADRGLAEVQNACQRSGAGIGLISDLAVGTDSGGSHAWSRKEDMLTGLSVGAPPDMLNHRGQDWGLTSFSPHALKAHGYAPFLEMLRASLRHAGGLRIDHILGLRRLWLIPEGSEPREGAYLQFPQEDLLSLVALESWRHGTIIVGEDLGTIPDNFRQHLADTGLLGIAVLWFEKDSGFFIDSSRWRRTALATTTTHDLPTVAGWWRGIDLEWNDKLDRLPEGRSREDLEQEREEERKALWAAFSYSGLCTGSKPASDEPGPVIDAALAFIAQTPAPLTLAPLEDLLGLEQQPNLPGTIHEHPNWRRRLPLASTEIAKREEASKRLAILARHCDMMAEGKPRD